MVEELRSRWCEDLEELLQCPVCYERPTGAVMQCDRGHHICTGCKDQMDDCPMCKCRYTGSRSYLAEELSLKLDDIKLSLMNPTHSINRKKATASVASQTGTDMNTPAEKPGAKQTKRAQPETAKGKFPCRIGACTHSLPHGRMIPHIRYYHENRFHESSSPNGDSYTQVWEMDYYSGASFDLAVRVAEMGLFFLNIKVNQHGDLYGSLQIVNSNYIGKQFKYELKIESGRRSSTYTSDVRTCRADLATLYQSGNCLHISSDDMCRMTGEDNAFTCTLTLNRMPQPVAKKRPVTETNNQVAEAIGTPAELINHSERLHTEMEEFRRSW